MTKCIMCDRCKTVFTEDTELQEYRTVINNDKSEGFITFHLCENCNDAFARFLENDTDKNKAVNDYDW